MEGYKAIGEEIIVKDMHTRKKMIFDKVSCSNYRLNKWWVETPIPKTEHPGNTLLQETQFLPCFDTLLYYYI